MKHQIEAIRSKADCREIARRLGIKEGVGGAWHCFNATAHSNGDRNPSLLIDAKSFKCQATSCAISGGPFDLLMRKDGLSFMDAVKKVAEMVGLEVEAGSNQKSQSYTPPSRAAALRKVPQPIAQPAEEVCRLMAALWAIVKPVKPTDQMMDWLRSRRLDVGPAHYFGVRDFAPVAQDIKKLLNDQPDSTLKAAGFMTESGYPWTPLVETINGNHAFAGACFPVYHPSFPDFPMEWRWRYYVPLASKEPEKKPLKVHALCGSNRLHTLGLNRPFKASRVLICEGEMDYLTLYEVQLNCNPAFDVIALGSASSPWREEYSKVIEDASLVVFVGHRSEKAKASKADEIEASMKALWGAEKARSRCIRYEVSEKEDLNDKLKLGTFEAWLKALTDLPEWSGAGIAKSGAVTRTNEHNTAAQAAGMGV